MKEKLLTGKQVEEYTDGVLSDELLRNWRCQGINSKELPFTKVKRRVFYKTSIIDKFLDSCSSGKQELPNQKKSLGNREAV